MNRILLVAVAFVAVWSGKALSNTNIRHVVGVENHARGY